MTSCVITVLGTTHSTASVALEGLWGQSPQGIMGTVPSKVQTVWNLAGSVPAYFLTSLAAKAPSWPVSKGTDSRVASSAKSGCRAKKAFT